MVYRFDAATGALTPNTVPAVEATKFGAAPRHLAFGKSGKFLYVCYEAGRAVATYAYDAGKGTLSPLDTQSTLPPDAPQTGSCAEIEVHPDGSYLYVSNRGHNSLALFTIDQAKGTLTFKDTFPVGGTPPQFQDRPDWQLPVCRGAEHRRDGRVQDRSSDRHAHEDQRHARQSRRRSASRSCRCVDFRQRACLNGLENIMAPSINRREFMTASAGIAAGLSVGGISTRAQTPAAGQRRPPAPTSSLSFKTKPHKALIARPTEEELRRMKDAGFEGVEARVHSGRGGREAADDRRQDRDACPLRSLWVGGVQQPRQERGRTNLRREPGGAANSRGVRRRHRAAGALPDWQPRRTRGRAGGDRICGCRVRGSFRSSSIPRTAI